MITWLRYVVHAEVERYRADGWEISDRLEGANHGHYAVLMVWRGEGSPPQSAKHEGKNDV